MPTHRKGRPYRRARELVFATYGTVCHWCGHEGAREVDHLIPVALDQSQPVTYKLMRPIHGSNSPCPVCVSGTTGRKRCCNQERGTKDLSAKFESRLPW